MSVIYIMLPAALVIVTLAIIAFVRAVLAGQYDDVDTPAYRALLDGAPTDSAPDAPKEPRPTRVTSGWSASDR